MKCPFRPVRVTRLLIAGLALVSMLALSGCDRFHRSANTARTVAEVKALPSSFNGSPTPVLIEGTITYWDPNWRLAFLQDRTGGMRLPAALFSDPLFLLGKHVEIKGRARSGGQEPILTDTEVRILDTGEVVAPAAVPLRDLQHGKYPYRLVRIQGVVQLADPNVGGRYRLSVATPDGRAMVWVADAMDRALQQMLDAEISVTGIVERPESGRAQERVKIWTRRADDLRVLRPPAALGTLPLTSARDLSGLTERLSLHRVHLWGRLQFDATQGALSFRDASGTLKAVPENGESNFGNADQHVYGFLSREGGAATLTGVISRTSSEAGINASGPPVLLQKVRQIHGLPLEDGSKSLPVQLRAVITFLEPQIGVLFVQDDTGGIYVANADMSRLKVGDLVEVEGVTGAGEFAPVVDQAHFKVLGRQELPRPANVPAEVIFGGSQDSNWVSMEGVVSSVRYDDNRPLLNVTYGRHSFLVLMPASAHLPGNLEGATVRLEGVSGTQFNSRRQLEGVNLWVPSEQFVHVLSASRDPVKASPIRRALQFDPARTDSRMRIEATVTYTRPGGPTFVQDPSGGILLRNHQRIGLQPGDLVSAEGSVASGDFGPYLEDVRVVRLGPGPKLRAVATAAEDVIEEGRSAELIQLDGTLVNTLVTPKALALVMESHGVLFTARTEGAPNTGELRIGSVLRLNGICHFASDPTVAATPDQFEMLLQSPEDIQVLKPAPWWTPQRTLILGAALALLMVLFALWTLALRSRVAQQTEVIRAKLERESQLEGQLAQAQKLESIGRLAGGVAHDFNNLLTVIVGYSNLLLGKVRAGDTLRPPLEAIRRAGERATELTQQLLTFSRKQILQPQPVSLNDLICETEDMLRRLVGEDISIVVSADPELAPVTADPNQIHQVLMNLAANARDAMPDGGQLRIRTGNVAHDPAFARSHPELTSGEFVLLEIADTGAGMDERTKSRLFEPFFTTKALGRGTGLGLATVYGIVRQSSGAIDVESEPGRGTTFRIYLPRSVAAANPPEAKAETPTRVTGSERVLVVEDVDGLRRLTVETLTGYGYEVTESPDGVSALAMVRKDVEVDLLITDVIMPGISGRELAERMRELRPRMRVLYMSGYTEDMISRHGVLDPGVMFLPKPFTPEKLLLKVRAVLGANVQP